MLVSRHAEARNRFIPRVLVAEETQNGKSVSLLRVLIHREERIHPLLSRCVAGDGPHIPTHIHWKREKYRDAEHFRVPPGALEEEVLQGVHLQKADVANPGIYSRRDEKQPDV